MSPVWQPTATGTGPSQDAGPTSTDGMETGAVCIPNISPYERRKRLVGGVVQLAIGLAVLTALIATGADRWWRLPLLLVFWGAAVCFFQWRDKT